MLNGDYMSCVQQLENEGYWVNTESRGFIVENQRWGDAHYECSNGKCLFAVKYSYNAFKRIKVRYDINIEAAGANSTTTYTCAAGFGIKRLVIWVLDPMEKLFEAMGTLVQMIVILQLLTSLLSAI